MLKIHHGADVICILEEIVTDGMQSKKTVSCVDFVRTCTADLSSTTMMHPLPSSNGKFDFTITLFRGSLFHTNQGHSLKAQANVLMITSKERLSTCQVSDRRLCPKIERWVWAEYEFLLGVPSKLIFGKTWAFGPTRGGSDRSPSFCWNFPKPNLPW